MDHTPSYSQPVTQQCCGYEQCANVPYHSTAHNKPPGKYANKQDMVDWLQANGCLADISMRKTLLCDFTEKLKLPEKIYKIDQIFNVHGHAVIRFPPYTCDLNLMELA
jgi:hypothetical protein